MEKITSLAKRLQSSYFATSGRDITLIPGDTFRWNHETGEIVYDPSAPDGIPFLLHETGHALLNHSDYPNDIALIAMERDAWHEATRIGTELGISIDGDVIEDALDSYREWLHARSTCPNCGATGVQTADKLYSCLACHHEWTVNDARLCALRRRDTKKRPR